MAPADPTNTSSTNSVSPTSSSLPKAAGGQNHAHGEWAAAIVFGIVIVGVILAIFLFKARNHSWQWLDHLKSKVPYKHFSRSAAPQPGPTVVVSDHESALPRAHSFGQASRRSTFDQGLPEYSHHKLPVYQNPPVNLRQISETSREASREPSVMGTDQGEESNRD